MERRKDEGLIIVCNAVSLSRCVSSRNPWRGRYPRSSAKRLEPHGPGQDWRTKLPSPPLTCLPASDHLGRTGQLDALRPQDERRYVLGDLPGP